jgi:hypothetical protein
MSHYIVGVIEEMDKQDTPLGHRIDIYLSMLKSSLGWKEKFVKAVAWNGVAEQVARCRKPQTIIVTFDKHADADEKYRDIAIKKVKATHVSRLTPRELKVFLTDSSGCYNPFNW